MKSVRKSKIWVLLSLATVISFLCSSLLLSCNNTGGAVTEKSAVSGESQTEEEPLEEAGLSYEGKELVISGSTTLLQVSEAWASSFMEKFGGTVIVNGGGSGGGIADLINGTNELANASRQIKDAEMEAAKNAGFDIQEYTVLYDGIAVIVSSNVSIENLTIEQLSKIYTAEITNWKDLGGEDAEIVIIARDSSSGTGEYFLEKVVQMDKSLKDNDYSEMALRLQSNADIVNQIKENDNSIGYIGLGYLEESLKAVKVEGILPMVKSVKDESYPISRGLYVYAPSRELTDIGQAYIDFVLGSDGQEIGLKEGFVPVK
jgi:phosphate transport system substrate-binding protein